MSSRRSHRFHAACRSCGCGSSGTKPKQISLTIKSITGPIVAQEGFLTAFLRLRDPVGKDRAWLVPHATRNERPQAWQTLGRESVPTTHPLAKERTDERSHYL